MTRIETLAVHAGGEPDRETGALSPPLHMATTFEHGPAGERRAGYEYQREGNPTQDRLETALAALEGGAAALAYGSGMAAMYGLLESLPAGAHFVYPGDCYTGLRVLASEFLPERGISATAVDMADLDAVRAALRPETRLLWAETPSNPRLELVDLDELGAIAGPFTVVDSTFATPLGQQPLAHGVDIVIHSATKGIAGHNDATIGVVAAEDELVQAIWSYGVLHGAMASPFDALNALRGVRTLAVRTAQQSANAQRLAEWLVEHPAVAAVHYPGLAAHPQHDLGKRQMRQFGTVLAFELGGGRVAAASLLEPMYTAPAPRTC